MIWPDQRLDVGALRASGHRPVPFREFVLKIRQRCNLACDYCYVYELADQSWRHRPAAMAPDVLRATADRIREHAETHGLDRVTVVLHGGEPLLAGRAGLEEIIGELRGRVGGVCEIDFSTQTNGVLLDEAMLRVLGAHRVRVGVSLDGTEGDHDRHRRYRNGRGSSAATLRALKLLRDPQHRASYGGLLCVVDPSTDPLATYEALLAHEPPAIDFLLPHATWASPPAREGEHGAWLARVFDRWYGSPRQETRVRLFDAATSLLLGGRSRSDQLGLSPVAVVVVESDGAIEQVDSLKSAYEGAAATGLTVFTNPFDEALWHPGIAARQIGEKALSPVCLSCPVVTVCGGGHYTHRYRPGDGFRNPSVYCTDLRLLIDHIRDRLAADLRPVL
jgi:uncharacterized protein